MTKIIDLKKEQGSNDLANRFAQNKATKVIGDGSNKATMNNRILPISDFRKVIEHDKIYLGTLQSLQANLSLYERLMAQKLTPIKNDDEKRFKRAKEFVEWDEAKIKLYDVRGMIETHNKLINDKVFHYENIALPQFYSECKEMENGEFEKQFEKSNAIANDLISFSSISDKAKTIVSEIKDELYWFSMLEEDFKSNTEYKLYLFKAIRRLNNAYSEEIKKSKSE